MASFINTLRPRQNGRHFADDIFKCIVLNENTSISIDISLKFVPEGRINNIPALVQIMAWRRLGDKSWSEPMMVSLLTHICVTRPQWVKALWPYDALCHHRTWPILVQVLTCCLTAPNHYLNQCWLIISGVLCQLSCYVQNVVAITLLEYAKRKNDMYGENLSYFKGTSKQKRHFSHLWVIRSWIWPYD